MRAVGLVLGGAAGVWLEVLRLEALIGRQWPGSVIAVNDAGVDWPRRLDAWATFHPEKFERVCPPGDTGDWLARRERNGHSMQFSTWANRAAHIVDRTLASATATGGSSGLLAVEVAWRIGCERAVLCGVPMERRRHYHDAHDGEPWKYAEKHWPPWEDAHEQLCDKLRSMSGRTARLYGYPTLEWLEG